MSTTPSMSSPTSSAGTDVVETGRHEVRQLGATRRGANRLLPVSVDANRQPGGLDRVDRAVFEVVQNDGRRRAASGADKLSAEQPQLCPEVTLGGHLAAKVDQSAEATVLVAQSEAVGDQRGHGWQEQRLTGSGLAGRTFRCRRLHTGYPSQRTGPCDRTFCRGRLHPKFEG